MIEVNTLETKRFGIKAASVTDISANPSEIQKVAKAQGIHMLTIRVGTDHLGQVQVLEDDGFRLMDTLVYYGRTLSDVEPPAPLHAPETIRLATPEDAPLVAEVAQASFKGYIGHYHADPRLSDLAADAAYVEWAQNSVLQCGESDPVYAYEINGCIVAFLTTSIKKNGDSEIILNGVHPDYQGSGIYGRLIERVIFEMKQHGCRKVIVSTQINNITVQKAWARKGLHMLHSYYTLHKWL